MNPEGVQVALYIGAVASIAFLVFLLVSGC